MHQERLNKFSLEENLQEDILKDFKQKAIELREESRTYKGVLEYLIEENLIIERNEEKLFVNKEEIEELIAFAKWIIDFQSISDGVNYGAIGWSELVIRDDYVVEFEETEKYLMDLNEIRTLRYEYGDYSLRSTEIDKVMFDKIRKSFYEDTSISFESLRVLLKMLSSHTCISDFIELDEVVVRNNIIEAPINSVVSLFLEETTLPLEEFYSCLRFLTIEKDRITDKNGNIPIWEQKKRKHKFFAQPLLVVQNTIIFSPISLYELDKSWFNGMMNFILPYDIGMPKTIEVVNKWKREYEKKIVHDFSSLFNAAHFVVHVDKEIYKLDPKGRHSRELGDYDIIIIDSEEKNVLLFEVKYMRLSQTMKDSLGDQAEYFTKKAKADKFERRVNYFQNNLN